MPADLMEPLKLLKAKFQQSFLTLLIMLSKQIVGKAASTNNFIFK